MNVVASRTKAVLAVFEGLNAKTGPEARVFR